MPKQQKTRAVEEFREKFRRGTIAIGTDFTGLSVTQLNELRRRLRSDDIEYRVVKNTLAYIAAREVDMDVLTEIIQGPTALILGYGDPLEPARILDEYLRVTRFPLKIRGAVMDGQVLSAEDVRNLAAIPPRDQLLAKLLGQMQAPMAKLVYVLQGPIQGLATVLQRHVETVSSVDVATPLAPEEPIAVQDSDPSDNNGDTGSIIDSQPEEAGSSSDLLEESESLTESPMDQLTEDVESTEPGEASGVPDGAGEEE